MEIDTKILNKKKKILAKQIQQYIKKSHIITKWDLFQGRKGALISATQLL